MPKLTEKKKHSIQALALVVLALLIAYVIWGLLAAAPAIKPEESKLNLSLSAPAKTLDWPSSGQAAIGLNNSGIIASYGQQTPEPTASIAKLITALCVLKKYPLSLNQAGPTITITPADVAIYNAYQAEDGSDLLVTSGEQLSEYQMLEAMLLPSADNIADSLAIWAFGSLSNYSTYANRFVKDNGLSSTTVGSDASGFLPSTTSTANDLVKLGELVMNNPMLASIVAKPSASSFPSVGTIKNVNFLLGQDNIVGIKTGNTTQAGGVYISASNIQVNGQTQTVITSIMQSPTLFDALAYSSSLIKSAQANFSTPEALASVQKGTIVGKYTVPWSGQTVNAIATQPINLDSWGGTNISEDISLKAINDKSTTNEVVGLITTSTPLPKNDLTTGVVLSSSPGKPSKLWTLLHPESFIRF